MPPRIRLRLLGPSVNVSTASSHPFYSKPFSSTLSQLKSKAKSTASSDKYTQAQRRAHAAAFERKLGSMSRKSSEADEFPDPIRGKSTPFVESFDDPYKALLSEKKTYKFDATQEMLDEQFARSKELAGMTAALTLESTDTPSSIDGMRLTQSKEEKLAELERDHAKAAEAVERILSLEHGSSKDKLRVNVSRCVDTFGRHNTDTKLPANNGGTRKVEERAGPDTGSSEVQIAILTAKIKTLADFLEKRGRGDKANRRNLRLLVHRRQKLLQYLRRRENGGPRWLHCIESLGLTESTWKGEITV